MMFLKILCLFLLTVIAAQAIRIPPAHSIKEPLTPEKAQEIMQGERWPSGTIDLLKAKQETVDSLVLLPEMESLFITFANDPVESLEVLRNLTKLEHLSLKGNVWNREPKQTSLLPLESCIHLDELNISAMNITDIDALASCKELRHVSISHCTVESLDGFVDLPKLSDLYLNGLRSPEPSYAPLAKMGQLRTLSVHLTSDNFDELIATLAQMENLNTLKLYSSSHYKLVLDDLAFLSKNKALNSLVFTNISIGSFYPIEELSALESLDLRGCKIDNITALGQLHNLRFLDISGLSISDLTPLSQLRNLERLSISQTRVDDLSALKNMQQLESLDISNTWMYSFETMPVMESLESLRVYGAPIRGLTGIAEKCPNLKSLDMGKTHVLDLSPLHAHPSLELLSLPEYIPAGQIEALKQAKSNLDVSILKLY